MIHLAPLEVADYVVSDAGLGVEYQDMLRAKGVEVTGVHRQLPHLGVPGHAAG